MALDPRRASARHGWIRAGVSLSPDSWPVRQFDGAPSRGEVHVWRAPLGRTRAADALLLSSVLDSHELYRARRFHFERDRTRYIAAHAAVRSILGGYLGVPPRQVKFTRGLRGKPILGGEYASAGLTFNLSRSENLALVAVTRDRDIGVDVELIRRDIPLDEISAHFTRAERALLGELPRPQRAGACFQLWTRKEAYLKATGDGLMVPLSRVGVAARVIATEASRAPASVAARSHVSRWSLEDLTPAPGYAAALAVAGGVGRLLFTEWMSAIMSG